MKARFLGLAVGFWAALVAHAEAWEFTPGTPCMLSHDTGEVSVELTYDPSVPIYTISLTQPKRFKKAAVFSMQFLGPMPISISTSQHVYSNDDRTVTVTDSGFGNVLNGLQFNDIANANVGTQQIALPLVNASEPVAAFRACDVLPAV